MGIFAKLLMVILIRICFSVMLQIGTSVAEYAEKCKECKNHGITWQPQVLAALHIEQVFVLVNNVIYSVSSTVKAVDICFKIFQVFNIEYPVECRLAGLCLQRGVYGIETTYDKTTARVIEIIGNMKKILPPTAATA